MTAFGNLPRVGAPFCATPGSIGLAWGAAAEAAGSGGGPSSGGIATASLADGAGAATGALGGGSSNWQAVNEANDTTSKDENENRALRLNTRP